MKINGIMIDASRLLERHEYYYRLVDFMAEWGMNALLFHFSDDHGLSVELPGYIDLARKHAFTADEVKKFVNHANAKGVDVIPELETFGHTHFITDHPKYSHLFVGRRLKCRLTFSAVNPLEAETHELMKGLIASTASLFPSKYLHIGCDEVDMSLLFKDRKDLDPVEVWSDYVNRIIAYTREVGKIPVLWADHLIKDPRIAEKVRKDVVAVNWHYDTKGNESAVSGLQNSGFKDVITAPALMCSLTRLLPGAHALENTRMMARQGFEEGAIGLINTLWFPARYIQGAMYYGIAYSGALVEAGGSLDITDFNRRFVQKVFGVEASKPELDYLATWPDLEIGYQNADEVYKRNRRYTPEMAERLQKINAIGLRTIPLAEEFVPEKNEDIWEQMLVAARAAWLISEHFELVNKRPSNYDERKTSYNRQLRKVRKDIAWIWDETRFPDDPMKIKGNWPPDTRESALFMMRWLPTL